MDLIYSWLFEIKTEMYVFAMLMKSFKTTIKVSLHIYIKTYFVKIITFSKINNNLVRIVTLFCILQISLMSYLIEDS